MRWYETRIRDEMILLVLCLGISHLGVVSHLTWLLLWLLGWVGVYLLLFYSVLLNPFCFPPPVAQQRDWNNANDLLLVVFSFLSKQTSRAKSGRLCYDQANEVFLFADVLGHCRPVYGVTDTLLRVTDLRCVAFRFLLITFENCWCFSNFHCFVSTFCCCFSIFRFWRRLLHLPRKRRTVHFWQRWSPQEQCLQQEHRLQHRYRGPHQARRRQLLHQWVSESRSVGVMAVGVGVSGCFEGEKSLQPQSHLE